MGDHCGSYTAVLVTDSNVRNLTLLPLNKLLWSKQPQRKVINNYSLGPWRKFAVTLKLISLMKKKKEKKKKKKKIVDFPVIYARILREYA